jgi:ribosomal protein S18 acetylase RimI-like enzyme
MECPVLADFGLMRAIHDHDELVALCDGDTLCLWAAQGLDGRGRAWVGQDGRTLAVAGTGISTRDRIAVRGSAAATVPLVREVMREVGPTYRPLGDRDLIGAIVDGVPGLVKGKLFGWMESVPGMVVPVEAGDRARWLSDADSADAAVLLESVNPDSNAKPGVPGVECWAGIRDDEGRLVALAALAWSAPTVGLITGVAVHADVQGRGLGRAVCAFILAAALERHGSAALMVDQVNDAADRLYRKLGMDYRPIGAAFVPSPRAHSRTRMAVDSSAAAGKVCG